MSNKENSDLSNVPLSSDSDQGDHAPSEVNSENNKNEAFSGNAAPISLDPDANPEDEEEKQRLIAQVLERQNTLDDLSSRVDTVKVENLKLKSENQVLGQYIENLMAASSVFQSASPKAKKK
ncbi:short coiled-coil protein B [Aplysia californica]|uniref:Short coiled-coil protein B n=1 Tax=Aplysia californica TaxID=6500 RepID=A0ABM0K4A2_APLCA|nr:short coiled-coil protein B [Aplysia californica]XP_005108400.1 short coiled-coil protein B [Aplysia californica]XP_035828298.1 short coiled-coil protein B [Aplysia californica]